MKWRFNFGSLFIVFLLPCFLLCFLAFGFPFFFLQLPKVLLSTIMSSFLSDSAINMSGSDSGGLIEQSIMDREVISIGSSSSEDTHQGASDSESSYSERVRASSRTGGGASHPCGGARPSAAARESVLVTVILSPSVSRGVRRSSGRGNVRASPCVQRSLSVGSPSSTSVVVGYEWVRDDMLKYKSCLTLTASVVVLSTI